MSKFKTEYFTMTESDVIDYVTEEAGIFSIKETLTCEEIGDGNLNYIFRICDRSQNRSIILKQAGPYARISAEFKVSPKRNRIEFDILSLHNDLVPGLVPKVYLYNSIMNCTLMEDLSDHTILRDALLSRRIFPGLDEQLANYMARTLLLTSDVVMDHQHKKALMGNFINPELCDITEGLVFSEPFFDCPRNDMLPETKALASELIWKDEALQLEMVKMKFKFMTKAEALLHGDLHTGAIFVKQQPFAQSSVKVIDPEFAFYGPMGHDIGNLMANFLFAYVNGVVCGADSENPQFLPWLKETAVSTLELFKEKFTALWREEGSKAYKHISGFDTFYLEEVLADSAICAGAELCRRIIGLAHVKDMAGIANREQRIQAEAICLKAAKTLILNSKAIKSGADYFRALSLE